MTIDTQSNVYKKDNVCDTIAILYKVSGIITEMSLATQYVVSNSLCPCKNVFLNAKMLNCARSRIKDEVLTILCTRLIGMLHLY